MRAPSDQWEAAQQEVLQFLAEVFHRIEWYYGENRAPFKYPPTFSITKEHGGVSFYQCAIETDSGEPAETIVCSSDAPGQLLNEVKKIIEDRYPQ